MTKNRKSSSLEQRNPVTLSNLVKLRQSESLSMPLGVHLVLFVSLHRVGGAPRGGAPEPPGRFLCCWITPSPP